VFRERADAGILRKKTRHFVGTLHSFDLLECDKPLVLKDTA